VYKLGQAQTYWRTVKLWQPAGDSGALEEASFDVRFKWLDEDAYDAFIVQAAEKRLRDRDVAPTIITGFRKLQAADGSDLAFSQDNLKQLLADPLVASAVMKAYIDSRAEAWEKNFSRPLVSGLVAAPTSTTAH